MRILLDECVPWPMHRLLTNHSCTNVQAQGWGGIKNGELLRLAETDFNLFIEDFVASGAEIYQTH
jgi:hypothetical protein